MIALDASALLTLLFREPGHGIVASHLGDACLSAVNFAEVVGRFVRDGHPGGPVADRIAAGPLVIVPFGVPDAALAASLLPATRPLGLSLADRACLALGLARGIPVLTADRVWAELDVGVEVVLLR